jgi:hypothetical protein
VHGLNAAGWTIGDRVTVNARNRNSHGWNGVIDGFSEEVPGILRIVVLFERAHQKILMTFQSKELLRP